MILFVGDILLDVLLLPELREDGQSAGIITRGGGSAANSAAWAERLGHPARFVGCVGDDLVGEMLVKELREAGVQTRVCRVGGQETGCVAVEVTPVGERVMRSSRGANVELSPRDVVDAATLDLDWVHVTGYALLGHHGFAILEAAAGVARQMGAHLSFDPSASSLIRHFGANRLLSELERCGTRILLPNALEAEALASRDTTLGAALALASRFPLVIVKDGAGGAVWSDGEVSHVSSTDPLRPLDTTGAGDAFNAGVLVGLSRGRSAGEACEIGHKVARKAIQQFGGRPPRL